MSRFHLSILVTLGHVNSSGRFCLCFGIRRWKKRAQTSLQQRNRIESPWLFVIIMYEYSIRSPGCPGGLTPPSRWWVICYKPLSPECPPAASGRWPSGNYPVPRFLGASCHNPRVNNNPLSDMQNLSELLASGSPPRLNTILVWF